MLHKTCNAQIKAAGEDDGLKDGEFTALVSVFDNVDLYGDVVRKGAFTDTLKDWADSGQPIPIYWSHNMSDPDYNIGEVVEAKEIDEGLWIKGSIDLDSETSKAKQVHRLMKGRRVTQFSFSYDIVEAGWEVEDEKEFYELRKLKLHEVGPTPIGANQATELLAVKAATERVQRFTDDMKAGRVLSKQNETTLREALKSLEDSATQIKDVLSAVDGEELTEKATADPPAKDEEPDEAKGVETPEEPDEAKSEEPNGCSPARVRLDAELDLLGV